MHSPLRWRNDVAQVSNRVDPVHTSDIRNLKQGRQSADKKCSIDIKVGKQGGEGMSSVNEKKKMYKIPNPTKTRTEVYSCGTCKYMMASGGVIAVSRLIGCYVFFVVFLGRHYILKIG